jgi:hypothetical protein
MEIILFYVASIICSAVCIIWAVNRTPEPNQPAFRGESFDYDQFWKMILCPVVNTLIVVFILCQLL